jgi:hypothetical protein
VHELFDEPAGDVGGEQGVADGNVADGGGQLAGPAPGGSMTYLSHRAYVAADGGRP